MEYVTYLSNLRRSFWSICTHIYTSQCHIKCPKSIPIAFVAIILMYQHRKMSTLIYVTILSHQIPKNVTYLSHLLQSDSILSLKMFKSILRCMLIQPYYIFQCYTVQNLGQSDIYESPLTSFVLYAKLLILVAQNGPKMIFLDNRLVAISKSTIFQDKL